MNEEAFSKIKSDTITNLENVFVDNSTGSLTALLSITNAINFDEMPLR